MAITSAPRKTPASPGDLDAFIEFIHSGGPGPHSYAVLLGLREFDSASLLRRVERGLSFRTFERLRRNVALTPAQLLEVVQIPQRTLTRRRHEGRFTAEESDRLVRVSRLFARAVELFDGDAEAARKWLSGSQPSLGGAVPLELARTELGAREVETAIGRIEHGVLS
jgi:putative toxin-antitoxin system antitoxin component (TIGR02293 family)